MRVEVYAMVLVVRTGVAVVAMRDVYVEGWIWVIVGVMSGVRNLGCTVL